MSDITRRDFINGTLMAAGSSMLPFDANGQAYEFGMKNGDLLDQGRVVAPERPGLGIEVDWDQLATADFYSSRRA